MSEGGGAISCVGIPRLESHVESLEHYLGGKLGFDRVIDAANVHIFVR